MCFSRLRSLALIWSSVHTLIEKRKCFPKWFLELNFMVKPSNIWSLITRKTSASFRQNGWSLSSDLSSHGQEGSELVTLHRFYDMTVIECLLDTLLNLCESPHIHSFQKFVTEGYDIGSHYPRNSDSKMRHLCCWQLPCRSHWQNSILSLVPSMSEKLPVLIFNSYRALIQARFNLLGC